MQSYLDFSYISLIIFLCHLVQMTLQEKRTPCNILKRLTDNKSGRFRPCVKKPTSLLENNLPIRIAYELSEITPTRLATNIFEPKLNKLYARAIENSSFGIHLAMKNIRTVTIIEYSMV